MTKRRQIIASLGIALAFCLALGEARAVDFTGAELARLEAGKTVKQPLKRSGKGGFIGGTGWALVDAPVEVVWKALQDWAAYPKVFPKTVAVEELNKRGKKSLVRMELGHKILSVEYYLDIIKKPGENTIAFSLAHNKPHDIEETRGYWRLFPQPGGRTLVAYVVSVEVPSMILSFLGDKLRKKLERHVIGLPGYLKDWVESPKGNRYRTLTARK